MPATSRSTRSAPRREARSRELAPQGDRGSASGPVEPQRRPAQFGPDGYLYLGTGDGGGAGDSPAMLRTPNVLLGKLLRIDPASPRPALPGTALQPVRRQRGRDEIYALGLRNPFRFSFDRRSHRRSATSARTRWEEVDYEAHRAPRRELRLEPLRGLPRLRLGTRLRAGPLRTADPRVPAQSGCAIIGGYVVRDPKLAACAAATSTRTCARRAAHGPTASDATATTSSAAACPTPAGLAWRTGLYIASLDGPVYRLVRSRRAGSRRADGGASLDLRPRQARPTAPRPPTPSHRGPQARRRLGA